MIRPNPSNPLKTRAGAAMLGKGAYSLSEVASYSRLPLSTVREWFKWRSDRRGRGPLLRSDYQPVGNDYAVSFYNLIDAYVVAFFKRQGVGPLVIRLAYQRLADELEVAHPFAHAELYTDNGRIIRRTATELNRDELIDVVSRQKWFPQWQAYLSGIEYASDTRLAALWRIADGVVINPLVGFGKPVIQSTAVTTFVLASQYDANGRG